MNEPDQSEVWSGLKRQFAAINSQKDNEISQMKKALEEIRDRAATMNNGGAWAAGLANVCLATLPLDQPFLGGGIQEFGP